MNAYEARTLAACGPSEETVSRYLTEVMKQIQSAVAHGLDSTDCYNVPYSVARLIFHALPSKTGFAKVRGTRKLLTSR